MTPEQTPEDRQDLRELLGAYALEALDPEERAQVDALLLTDASARAELHELQHAAAWLGHASLRPPESVWDSIAAEVGRDGAEDRVAAPLREASTPAPVHSPAAPRRLSRWLVAAAAVVVLAIGGVGVFTLVDRSSGPDSVSTQYADARSNPSAHKVNLTSTDGQYTAQAVVLPDGVGYLADTSMPTLPPGRDWQLWSITPDGPVSVGVIHGAAAIHRFKAAPHTNGLAVTNEPRGGSEQPTTQPVIRGDLATA
jgi:anti-sigma-K factor RskA